MNVAIEGQIQSMTGFAQVVRRVKFGQEATSENATLTIELRSVNSRYLDLTFKAPDDLRHFESLLRELISAQVKRGKLECRVALKRDTTPADASLAQHMLNKVALSSLLAASSEVLIAAQANGVAIAAPSTLDILKWPGVWGMEHSSNHVDLDAQHGQTMEASQNTLIAREDVSAVAQQCLADFAASRLREGAQTAKAMLAYCDEIAALVARLDAKLPSINAEIQNRFAEKVWDRLSNASASAGDDSKAANGKNLHTILKTEDAQNRINQELVLMAMRADVSEEISRLKAHIQEFRTTLAGAGAVGKKLDFLMQEFNREANTLGSKAPNLEVSKASTELKLAIEQIREQVQNLE
jgi:uncharacterized protein (TIGR00255 family)